MSHEKDSTNLRNMPTDVQEMSASVLYLDDLSPSGSSIRYSIQQSPSSKCMYVYMHAITSTSCINHLPIDKSLLVIATI